MSIWLTYNLLTVYLITLSTAIGLTIYLEIWLIITPATIGSREFSIEMYNETLTFKCLQKKFSN